MGKGAHVQLGSKAAGSNQRSRRLKWSVQKKDRSRLQTNAGACAKKAGAEANWERQCSVQRRQGSSGRRRQVGFLASVATAQCCCTQKLALKWIFASGAAISYAWAVFLCVTMVEFKTDNLMIGLKENCTICVVGCGPLYIFEVGGGI